ncbi:MAG TPA: flagellar basal body rod protein FlgC [Rhodanobacteraceae bacterium]|nr:flagellar basal body rod protein FlgC [Rhodanobacteraceae bacterium]
MNLFGIFQVAGSGMAAETLRLNTTASNLANAGSVSSSSNGAYRAREPVFTTVDDSQLEARTDGRFDVSPTSTEDAAVAGVRLDGVTESQAPIQARYEPGNPMADANGDVYTSNVNPIDELVNMISASRSYQDDVDVIGSTKQLMLQTLNLGNTQ